MRAETMRADRLNLFNDGSAAEREFYAAHADACASLRALIEGAS